MEEQNHISELQFSPPEIDWLASNACCLVSHYDYNRRYIMAPGSGFGLAPASVHQWICCQPTPQTFVQFLAETGYPDIQKQMFYDISARPPTLGLPHPSQLEEYLRLHNGRDFVTTTTGLEQLGAHEREKTNEESSHAYKTCLKSDAAASKDTPKVNSKRSRERAYATDRCRRLKISHWLDALQELVPHPEGVNQSAFLDIVVEHIKYLQTQAKDLCQSRLGGESDSDPVIFVEEHGHYLIKDEMLNGPLEDMLGKLIRIYPSAATELLQSRGLIVLPMAFAEGLLESSDMLDIQGAREDNRVASFVILRLKKILIDGAYSFG